MISTGDTFLARYCASSSVADKKPISPVIATSSGSHHHIVQIFAADEAIEIGGEVTPAPVGRTLGKPRAMRRHQHVRQFVKRKADRKSTRLNSSHLGISYAVFCLKKKTT